MPCREISNKEDYIKQSCKSLLKPFVEQTEADQKRVDRLLEYAAASFSVVEMHVFTLRFIEQKTYRQIAKEMGYRSPCPVQYHVTEIVRKFKIYKAN